MKTHSKITALAGFSLLLIMIVAAFSLRSVTSPFPTLIAILLTSSVLLLAFASFIRRAIFDRLNRLREGVSEFSRGNLDHRLHVEGTDEISLIAEQMNGMAGSLRHSLGELEDKLSESTNARASIGQLEMNVRHEINNPLTTIIGNVELLIERYEDKDKDLTSRLEAVLNNALRIAEISKRLQESKKENSVNDRTGINTTDST